MLTRFLADLVLVFHLAFVVFVLLGALLVWVRPWLAFIHLPAVTWAVLLEFFGWICPLTPLEQDLRRAAGQAGYEGGFVEHYLVPILYPPGLTPSIQWVLGGIVLLVNLFLYGLLIRRRLRRLDTPAD